MGKEKEFENILNECLDRLMQGENIESCLAQYPEHAAELEPLLKTALETRAVADIKPRPEFREQAGIEFQKAIAEMPAKAPRSPFRWRLRWVIPVAVFLVLFSGGAGTVIAATNALPDSPLYGIKLAVESVQLAFTFSEEGKAELYTQFVNNRVEEIVKMAEEGKYDQVERATAEMNVQLLAMADLNLGGDKLVQEEGASFMMSAPTATTVPQASAPETSNQTSTILELPPATDTPVPVEDGPPVVITEAPAPTIPEVPERATKVEDTVELSDIDKLKQLLWEQYQQNLLILLEQLEKAPDSLKPALEQAIKVLRQGYELVLASIG